MKYCTLMLYFLSVFNRVTLYKGLAWYCNHVMGSRNSANHIILYFNTLAIFHILKGKVKPFAKKETDPKRIEWIMVGREEFSMSSLLHAISVVKSPK